MHIEKFTIIQFIFSFIQFGLFLAILLLEIFLTFSSSINRWIVSIAMMAFSLIVLVSTCIKKIRSWLPILERGYKVGISVLIAGALDFGETFYEVRSIIAYIIMASAVVYIILSGALQKNDIDDSALTYQPQNNFLNAEAGKFSIAQSHQPTL